MFMSWLGANKSISHYLNNDDPIHIIYGLLCQLQVTVISIYLL